MLSIGVVGASGIIGAFLGGEAASIATVNASTRAPVPTAAMVEALKGLVAINRSLMPFMLIQSPLHLITKFFGRQVMPPDVPTSVYGNEKIPKNVPHGLAGEATQNGVGCESLTPTRGATQKSMEC